MVLLVPVFALLIAVTPSNGQSSFAGLPSCALACNNQIVSNAGSYGCADINTTDPACGCRNSGVISDLSDCVCAQCDYNEANASRTWFTTYCSALGVSPDLPTSCSNSTSGNDSNSGSSSNSNSGSSSSSSSGSSSSGGKKKKGLSTGGKAGIGVGVALLVISIAGSLFAYIKRRRAKGNNGPDNSETPPGPAPTNTGPETGNQPETTYMPGTKPTFVTSEVSSDTTYSSTMPVGVNNAQQTSSAPTFTSHELQDNTYNHSPPQNSQPIELATGQSPYAHTYNTTI